VRKRTDYMKEITTRNDLSQRTRKSKFPTRIEPIDKARILLELMRSRRSIRFFKKTPIPDEHLMMILEGARWAPSPANAQPWKFLVIKDQRIKRNLMNTMKKVGNAVRERYAEFRWGTTSRDPELISKVAVIVAVCADFNREELRKYDVFPLKHKKEIVSNSIAVAIQNMMLMATALGVGSLWITPVSTGEIKRLLRIPKTLQLIALVPLGYPARDHIKKTNRRSLETLVHYDEIKAT
jgi:nitroreductase